MLKRTTPLTLHQVICDVIEEYKPDIMPSAAPPTIGRDLGPRCAPLHTGPVAGLGTHLDVDMGIYKDFLKENSTLAPSASTPQHAMVLGRSTTSSAT